MPERFHVTKVTNYGAEPTEATTNNLQKEESPRSSQFISSTSRVIESISPEERTDVKDGGPGNAGSLFQICTKKPSSLRRSISPAQIEDESAQRGLALNEGEPELRMYSRNANGDLPKKDQLFLFQDDLEEGMKVGTFLHEQSFRRKNSASRGKPGGSSSKASVKLGTVMGVFLPCIQNIFGVLMFIRLPWVIGTAGVLEAFVIVLLASATSLLCAFSMSAIATNGVVPHGGSYFMISRSLGPELGGAVGFMFAIGQSIATGMYVVAAVEICVTYMAPQLLVVGKMNCYRIYGSILIVLLGCIAMLGLGLVNKFALFFLFCVLTSVGSVLVGMIVNAASGNPHLKLCILGDRLLAKSVGDPCIKNVSSPLWNVFCGNSSLESCDEYFQQQPMREELAFPGMGNLLTFLNNSFSQYAAVRQILSEDGRQTVYASSDTPFYTSKGFVMADISGSFTVLLSIFFPAVTGIMAGSNRSGDLRNVQKAIPIGTICAVLFTTSTYIVLVFAYAGSVNSLLLRDKYGKSIGGRLVAAEISWPHPLVLLIGAMMATIGAALQTLIAMLTRTPFFTIAMPSTFSGTGQYTAQLSIHHADLQQKLVTRAPRLILAIAKDGVIDFLRIFSVVSSGGEPRRALCMSLVIAELTILAGSIDLIAPILSQFSLICYLFVNLACALQSVIRNPNWRPRFPLYHWTLSLCGGGLAIAIMFISSWYYACIAIATASIIYKYIDFRGAEKEWGDGWSGLALSAARYSLLRLEGQTIHTKNWRPQLLVFCRLDEEMKPEHAGLFTFASQLKAGRGLTVFATIIEGRYLQSCSQVMEARRSLQRAMEAENVKGFSEVLVASDAITGMNHLIQTAGIGSMKHNTVVMSWPQNWRQNTAYNQWKIFLDTLRTCHAAHCALLVPKNIAAFPNNQEKMVGYVDVWWIVHDGGLLMLLPFLLLKTKTWKHCKMRLFTIAQLEDNTIQIQKDLKTFLYGLRIDAETYVVEMGGNDISAYTYERTLLMEQRVKLLKEMKLIKRDSVKHNVQLIVDQSHSYPALNQGKDRATTIRIDSVPSILPASRLFRNASTVDDAEEAESLVAPYNQQIIQPGGAVESAENDHLDESRTESPPVASNSRPGLAGISGRLGRLTSETERGISDRFGGSRPLDGNVRRMHTAVTLNEVIKDRSAQSQLVILNLPQPPKSSRQPDEMSYMEFVEVLTDGLQRVLMVRGAGREVVTIYS